MKPNNKKIRRKTSESKKIIELDRICDKHNVGNLTFRSCSFANIDGQVTSVDYEEIKGNMKAKIMIIKARDIIPIPDIIYDLVKIDREKKERDEKKRLEEIEKLKDEQNVDHQKMMELIDPKNEIENPIPEDITRVEDNVNPKLKSKRDKALKKIKELQNDADKRAKKDGNKYHRKLIKDIKTKFVLEEQFQYNFCEVKVDVTDMVIDKAKIYKMMVPNTKKIYFLVVGDIQMKNGLIKQMDPCYKSERLLQDQTEFFEKIKEKENNK